MRGCEGKRGEVRMIGGEGSEGRGGESEERLRGDEGRKDGEKSWR